MGMVMVREDLIAGDLGACIRASCFVLAAGYDWYFVQ